MSKVLTDKEVAEIIMDTIEKADRAPWAHFRPTILSEETLYQSFLHDLGMLVANYFGGRFNQVCVPDGIEGLGYTLSFTWDLQVPNNGGVYARYDTDIGIDEWRMETCLRRQRGRVEAN